MMIAMEAVLCELSDHEKRKEQGGLPPGFRFHPTDEELITFYLASKVFNATFTAHHLNFAEVDLNRCEPWELPEVAKMGEREWYLFSLRDRKYPSGLRTNRATGAGYWKATGKDKEVYSASSTSGGGSALLIGMKKTLVFYKGRAPRGEKTKWVMHEYRLDGHFSLSHIHTDHTHTCKEEWVICRIFHKSGEKRSPLLQVQGHTSNLDASSSPSSKRDFQSPVLIHHQHQNHDLSHSSHLFPLHAFQPSFPISAGDITNTTNHEPIFKVKEQSTIPKPSKTEATIFYPAYQQLLDDANDMHWIDKLNQNPNNFHNSNLPLDHMDAGLMGFSSGSTANAEIRDMMSTNSIAFNKAGLQQMLDAPIGIDSWPPAQHV